MSNGTRYYLSRLHTVLIFLVLNGMAKMRLAILPFLCCGEMVKNSDQLVKTQGGIQKFPPPSKKKTPHAIVKTFVRQ